MPKPTVKPIPAAIAVAQAPQFSMSEAQTLINIARSAPTVNMDDADRRRMLLERFARWYEHAQKTPTE